MKNLLVVFTTILLLESSCPLINEQPKAQRILQHSCQYLWNQQSANGGWHSKQHNQLRGGASLTAFLLYTLLQVPEWIYESDERQLKKATQFIRRQTNSSGAVGYLDPDFPDRPHFATAYALLALKEIGAKKDSVLIQKMTNYLKQQQLTVQNGFTPKQYAYGSWASEKLDYSKQKNNVINLNHTRLILMALEDDSNFDRIANQAKYFFQITQKAKAETRVHPTGIPTKDIPYDGGFFESPVNLGINKAGIQTDGMGAPFYFRSYASATCEGLLGLAVVQNDLDQKEIQDAFDWLDKHQSWSDPSGITYYDSGQRGTELFYEHLTLRAEVYALMGRNDQWKEKVIELLEKRQYKNGRFQNEAMDSGFENDPLVATGLAVASLCWALE